jgi:hypothetical protein
MFYSTNKNIKKSQTKEAILGLTKSRSRVKSLATSPEIRFDQKTGSSFYKDKYLTSLKKDTFQDKNFKRKKKSRNKVKNMVSELIGNKTTGKQAQSKAIQILTLVEYFRNRSKSNPKGKRNTKNKSQAYYLSRETPTKSGKKSKRNITQ